MFDASNPVSSFSRHRLGQTKPAAPGENFGRDLCDIMIETLRHACLANNRIDLLICNYVTQCRLKIYAIGDYCR